MITIKNVCKAFGPTKILDDISLNLASSHIVGLAGPSGGGKSTLLRCIQGFETPESGSITCKGRTGFMFQDFQLFPHMTVFENLVYAPNLHSKSPESKARNLLEILGIASKDTSYPHTLSGGQKQRVALARSLMMKPDILLCDEPTSGLDIATTWEVVSLLESVRSMNVTMVLASHDLDFLTQIADRIVLLKGGKIVADIEPRSIKNPIDTLREFY